MTTASAFIRDNSHVQFLQEHAKKEDNGDQPLIFPSTSVPTNEKMEQIFNARASTRSRMRTDNKIKTFISATMILIGIGAIIAAGILGGGIPIGAAIGIAMGGQVVGLFGAFFMPTKRILKDEEEKQFWKSISEDSLSELTRKRWNWYCVGSPYYGSVKGVCKITYTELQDHGLISPRAAKKLEAFLEANKQLEDKEAQELANLGRIRPEVLVADSREKIKEKYIEPKLRLQNAFETFRTAFIEETYQKFCT